MPDKIDTAVDAVSPAYRLIRQRLVTFAVSVDPDLATIAGLDFGQLALTTLGGQSVIDATILTAAEAIDALTAEGLAIGALDGEFYAKHLRGVGEAVKRALITAITERQSADALRAAITAAAEGVLSDAQIGAVLNTGMRTYDRRVFAELSADLPSTARYIYSGPLDDRTRDACRGVLKAQPDGGLPRAEYLKLLAENGVGLVDGGGFNCRHITEVI